MKNHTSIKILKENFGITLTELLVATVMIGIVMIGVASFSGSITRLQGSTSRSTIIAMRTKAVMARIVQDAKLAVGNNEDCGKDDTATPPLSNLNCGWGIRTEAGGGGKLGVCFRHDLPGTPDSYSDDTWICYYKSAGANNRLFYCGATAPANVPPTNAGSCNLNLHLINLWETEDDYYEVIENAAGQLLYVELTISNIYDRLLGAAGDPMTNPTYVLTTRVSPPGHSR